MLEFLIHYKKKKKIGRLISTDNRSVMLGVKIKKQKNHITVISLVCTAEASTSLWLLEKNATKNNRGR
jgi:hypothetical protein